MTETFMNYQGVIPEIHSRSLLIRYVPASYLAIIGYILGWLRDFGLNKPPVGITTLARFSFAGIPGAGIPPADNSMAIRTIRAATGLNIVR